MGNMPAKRSKTPRIIAEDFFTEKTLNAGVQNATLDMVAFVFTKSSNPDFWKSC
jgi:hypothetical protein